MATRRLKVVLVIAALSASALSQTPLDTKFGDAAGDAFGASVAALGDVNADGVNDYAVGAWGNDFIASNAGLVRVFSGSTGGVLYELYGASANDRLGWVTGTGDLTNDGHDDILVGAPGGDYANLYSGATGTLVYQLTGSTGFFGVFVNSGGELDGDGVPDLMVGAPFAGVGGELTLFSGATGTPIRTHTWVCSGYLGQSGAFLGDIDGDGVDEYAIGRPLPNFGCGVPEVHAFDGATGTLLWSSAGYSHTDEFGWAVETINDVTGDGVRELLAGAPQDPGVGCGPCNGKGYVRLLNGATGATIWEVFGTSSYAGLGTDLAILGDLNEDGFDDFAVSQPSSEQCGGNTQDIQVRDGVTGALLFEVPNQAASDKFGASIAASDLNGDGLRDFLVGTECDDNSASNAGAAYLYTIVRGVLPYCEGKVNSQGCTPTIFATGSPSFSVPTFRIRSADQVNNKFGILFWGRGPREVPFQGGSLCVAGQLIRTPAQLSGGNPPPNDCSGTFTFHFSGVYMNSEGVLPGDEIFCQYWSRDPQSPSGTGLTAGLAFQVLP